MKLLKITLALIGCSQASMITTTADTANKDGSEAEDKEKVLSQSFVQAFNMAPPKLMPKNPEAGKGNCPVGENIKTLTRNGTGGAFLDGCYMNTTRS